jgi:hypothetical protein
MENGRFSADWGTLEFEKWRTNVTGFKFAYIPPPTATSSPTLMLEAPALLPRVRGIEVV